MTKEAERQWRIKYRATSEHYKKYVRAYRLKNRDRMKRYSLAYYQKHKIRNRDRNNKYARQRRATNVNFRLRVNLAARLTTAIRQKQKAGKTIEMLGCSIPEFKIYIESKFESGMSWENYGRGEGKWHLDHIVPCAIFDLEKSDHQKRCFHFSNYQPLWQPDNLSKPKRPKISQFQLL